MSGTSASRRPQGPSPLSHICYLARITVEFVLPDLHLTMQYGQDWLLTGLPRPPLLCQPLIVGFRWSLDLRFPDVQCVIFSSYLTPMSGLTIETQSRDRLNQGHRSCAVFIRKCDWQNVRPLGKFRQVGPIWYKQPFLVKCIDLLSIQLSHRNIGRPEGHGEDELLLCL